MRGSEVFFMRKTMKMGNMLMLTLVSALGVGGLAAAQENPSIDSPPTEAIKASRATSETTVDIEGRVESVDRKNHSLQIRDKSGNISPVVITPETKITRNGKPVKLRRLRKGDVVDVDNAR